MVPYDQIIDVELTTNQVLLVLAMITASVAQTNEWLNGNLDNKEKLEEIAETVEDLRKLHDVFNNARIRIEESWLKKDK